jgi:alpha-glucosidase
MHKIYILLLLSLCSLNALSRVKPDSEFIYSPDKQIKLMVEPGPPLRFSIFLNDQILLQSAGISMQVDTIIIPDDESPCKTREFKSVDEIITPSVPQKRSSIRNYCNQLTLTFAGGNQVIFRVYNEGVAYRFITHMQRRVKVISEHAEFTFSPEDSIWFPSIPDRSDSDRFNTSFELRYIQTSIKKITPDSLGPCPALIQTSKGPLIGILEAAVRDYPGMFIKGSATHQNTLESIFPEFPIETTVAGDPYQTSLVTKRAPFIAETSGERAFPWRVVLIAPVPMDLLSNDLVYCLSDQTELKDLSWIRPGKAMDNWIIDGILSGVDFVSGNNTSTYKYYIDFAAEYGIEYIMVEPVWSDLQNILKPVPEMDMKELFRYAKSKNVGLWLWTEALALDKNREEILDSFQLWGAKGFMVDFFNRNDQQTVNQFEQIAKSAAEHKLLLMFHGAFPSSGFERTWPNVLTREAVAGSEYNKWANWITPDHNLDLPFIRGLSGPFDYEPLVMPNATKESFRVIGSHPQSQGTRAAEIAKFIIYSSPFQVISGSPTDFKKDEQVIRFISQIPTTWDETIPLSAKVGDYALLARRKGANWFVAGMTDWTPGIFHLDFSFLGEGNYEAVVIEDGLNADREACDYRLSSRTIQKGDRISIKTASGGGVAICIKPVQ